MLCLTIRIKRNDEFNAMMKREHPFLYAFKKAEPFIMWFGFITFLFGPFVEVMLDAGFGEDGGGALYAIIRGIQGGAMGLGFANWLRQDSDDKMRFRMMDYVNNFFTQIREIMEEVEQKEAEAKLRNSKIKRAD